MWPGAGGDGTDRGVRQVFRSDVRKEEAMFERSLMQESGFTSFSLDDVQEMRDGQSLKSPTIFPPVRNWIPLP